MDLETAQTGPHDVEDEEVAVGLAPGIEDQRAVGDDRFLLLLHPIRGGL
jgi:hypothetical protein